ncbi:MAG TPA: hypothetical protein VGM54_02125 [Chthoniobacter sp.]|jgi:hypothetical protein
MESLSGIGTQVHGVLRQLFSWPILSLDGGSFYPGSIGVSGQCVQNSNATGGIPVTDAPVSGQRLVITDIRFSSDTQLQMNFIDQSTNAVLFTEYVSANSGGQITLRGKVKLASPDATLGVQTNTTGNIAVTVSYYSEP